MLNRNDLELIHEVLEEAVQLPGFVDTTSSGGCTFTEEQAYLTEMRQVMRKVHNELITITSLERIELLEAYMTDLRKSVHGLTHTMYLIGKPGGDSRCPVCRNRLIDEPGEIRT